DPVFEAAKLRGRHRVRYEAKPINLADRGRQRRKLRLDVGREIGLLKALEDALAGEVVVDAIIERQRQERKAELCVRKHPDSMRYAGQRDLERNRDLFFDFFGSVPWKPG